jgi:hypothetical protein
VGNTWVTARQKQYETRRKLSQRQNGVRINVLWKGGRFEVFHADAPNYAYRMVHNHPSGDPTPSRADIDTTERVVEAAKPLGIIVHDHIVIGRNGHASFKTLGLL